MKINLLAFGIAKTIVGGPALEVELAEGSTVDTLKNVLQDRFPPLRQLASFLIAVNNEYGEPGDQLQPNDEVAVIPPVSGG